MPPFRCGVRSAQQRRATQQRRAGRRAR
eukprot:SAG25_NODE_7680_length_466_cov_1.386921_1_plen_27_part_10